ncbi:MULTISPECIES: hypothetical protein [unclassified Thiomonas]|jgi:hypothetical protein|uniref:hypothetical protein n=1 Tax=unclassified Thiomonas TaxID=2625466 RepID=UPI0004DBA51A|nr:MULTISPECIES: hypothetical protein [unclassified Thiomonas]CQR45137.1 conserved hypothetical protein [Thiomonas sp. CB3]CDW95031.1 conserved hypothetical protein [Thiomonas sp. CB2]VDY03902.1 conserved protein of unknown function [Thiomonas sp. Bio17B3]VDY08922.1 conserved protein of unknown function [Thiomonas sp. Sup16B3]VDY12151.1 hypothetical protein TOC7_10673 [Thiomonas sp. OC7]
MSHKDLDPTQRLVDVDWNKPELQELLRKTAHLHLDNRYPVNKRPVLLRQGWHTSAPAQAAIWVDLGPDAAQRVLLTTFALEPGEPIMLDRRKPGADEPDWIYAEVSSCRQGQRVGDEGLFVVTLRLIIRPPVLAARP